MPPVTSFIDGSGPIVAGKVFPFCFITIACGSISGFHTLVASGTTPKMITRESQTRSVGYGAMCLESLVAIMALVAACTLEPGVYLSMNMQGQPEATVAKSTALGFPVTTSEMQSLADQLGEKSIFGRTGGAATLAVGMARIFARVSQGRWLDLWYHFAIMFEALFILTTIDAGTRVGRYLVQDMLGHFVPSLGDTRRLGPNLLASSLVVGGWAWFLIQGVVDPLGGINTLWPLFGIANQLLATIALCLATTILLKMHLRLAPQPGGPRRRPWVVLVTLLPLVWLLSVTMTAGAQKLFHPDPRIGFLAAANGLQTKMRQIESHHPAAVDQARAGGAAKGNFSERTEAVEWHRLATQRRNNLIDAAVAAVFLVLVGAIVVLGLVEWVRLLAGLKPPDLHETNPLLLPPYAAREPGTPGFGSVAALGLALLREVSGQTAVERATVAVTTEPGPGSPNPGVGPFRTTGQAYADATDRRYRDVRRCC
jgi:carbon starvation protein